MNKIKKSSEYAESETKKGLLTFWLRMIGWFATGVATPISIFAIKFGLFTEYGYSVQKDELGNVTQVHIAFNGWGIVSIVLISVFVLTILNEVIDAYAKKYSFTKQCLIGLKNKILPLAIAIGICFFLKGAFDQIIFCLVTIGISQIAAIPLNPLPEWKAKVRGEEDYSDLITGFTKFLKSIKSKSKSKKDGGM